MNKIEVTPLPKKNLLGGPENMVTELKTSIFFAPGESVPGVKQYYQIAKTIAGFVNGEGGVLWLGVDDNGGVAGIESDLAVLGGERHVASGGICARRFHPWQVPRRVRQAAARRQGAAARAAGQCRRPHQGRTAESAGGGVSSSRVSVDGHAPRLGS